jgi:hypothetical protein
MSASDQSDAIWLNADLRYGRQIVIGGKVNSRWLQARDLDLFLGISLVMEPCHSAV